MKTICQLKFLIFVSAIFFSQRLSAQIFVEPFVGYQLGTHELISNHGSFPYDQSGSANGFGLGARAGYSYALTAVNVWAALDFQYSSVTFSAEDAFYNGNPTSVTDPTGTQMLLGVTGGAEFSGIRAWLGYYFLNNLTWDDSNSLEFSGGTFKIGAGYKVIPLVSVNIEYLIHSYSTYEGINLQTAVFDNMNLDHSAVFISASVPYEFEL